MGVAILARRRVLGNASEGAGTSGPGGRRRGRSEPRLPACGAGVGVVPQGCVSGPPRRREASAVAGMGFFRLWTGQLTLEQHGFDLCGSTYTRIFFSLPINTVVFLSTGFASANSTNLESRPAIERLTLASLEVKMYVNYFYFYVFRRHIIRTLYYVSKASWSMGGRYYK